MMGLQWSAMGDCGGCTNHLYPMQTRPLILYMLPILFTT
jgi:hypothetical protein